jgi:putative tryptophan/tyrosine transport system substrate-binding protein
MVTRIIVVLLVSLVHSSLGLAQTQQPKKVARIGYLAFGFSPGSPEDFSPLSRTGSSEKSNTEAFYQGLKEVGYIEGKNLIIEYRHAKRKPERFPELTAELVSSKVDLIVAPTTPAIRAARQATTTIPIVMLYIGDLVTEGIIDSLARPGGNITGLTANIPALSGKLLQVLVDAVPGVTRVGVLSHPGMDRLSLTETENAARALRVQLKILEARNRDELEDAFSATTKDYPRSLVILPAILFARNERRIADLSIRRRLPTIFWRRQFAEAGGLLAYGPSLPDLYRRMGVLTGKVLKGTKPADLPVEQPTKYELVVNLMTAKQIGLTIPQSLLFRADKVIK